MTGEIDWTPLRNLIFQSEEIIILSHVRPDGDAVGACLGLALLIQSQGRKVRIELDGGCPANLRFLEPQDLIFPIGADAVSDRAGIVVLDTGTWNQLRPASHILKTPDRKIVVVDHHRTQDDLGGVLILDTDAEAASVLVARYYREMKATPDVRAATALFVGLANDTGWFRHSNCKPSTFELAAELVRCGAQPTWIYEKLFSGESIARQRVKGHVLSTMSFHSGGRIGLFKLHQSDIIKFGATPEDGLGGLVDLPRQVAGVQVALALYEQPDGATRASLRSDGTVDVAAICVGHGGGGHKPAAGCTLKVSPDLAEAILVPELVASLDVQPRIAT